MFFTNHLAGSKRITYSLMFTFFLAIFAPGCKYDKEEILNPNNNNPSNCATVPATFNADILPLFTTKCAIAGCHDATASGGNTFQSYNQISSVKDRIHIRAVVQKSMPPTGPLPQTDIDKIKCWIEAGALNN